MRFLSHRSLSVLFFTTLLFVVALLPTLTFAGGGGSNNTVRQPGPDSAAFSTPVLGPNTGGATQGEYGPDSASPTSNVVCKQDAKMCPNGRAVTRTGPNCTFPACPGTATDSGVVSGGTSGGTVSGGVTGTPGSAGGSDATVRQCPPDAKICPNGTAVGRSGPNCTFPACPSTDSPLACTKDAKVCPDGTYVGRTGPNCTFAPCTGGPLPLPNSLTSTSWSWVKTQLPDRAAVTAPAGHKFVITFSTDNTFDSTTDCNRLGGKYVSNGQSSLSMSGFFSTEMACQNSLEDTYTQFLALPDSYSISGNTLTMTFRNNQGTMTFTKKAGAVTNNPNGTASTSAYTQKEVSSIAIAESLGINTKNKAVQASIIMAGEEKSAKEIRESLENFVNLYPNIDIDTVAEQAGLGVTGTSNIQRAAEALRAMAGYANRPTEYSKAHGVMVRYLNTIAQSVTDAINNGGGGTSGNICPMDVKTCPGGSFVSRSGPNCTFVSCPTVSTTSPIVPYSLADVKTVSSIIVDPEAIPTDDVYTEYTITLFSNKVHVLRKMTRFYEEFEKALRETGYTGDISALLALAGNATACAQDAKICPDGSSVGRVAPTCKFAECSATTPNPNPNPTPSAEQNIFMGTMQNMMNTLQSMMSSLQSMMRNIFGGSSN
jgi:heat shock protein HslJ